MYPHVPQMILQRTSIVGAPQTSQGPGVAVADAMAPADRGAESSRSFSIASPPILPRNVNPRPRSSRRMKV